MQETWVRTLGDVGSIPGSEDLLEEKMAIHSSIIAWKIWWTEEPAGLSPEAHKELDMVEQLSTVGIDKIYFTFPWKHMKTTKIRMLQKLWIVFCWVTYLSEIIFSFIVKVWWFESPKRSILQDRAMTVLVNKIV